MTQVTDAEVFSGLALEEQLAALERAAGGEDTAAWLTLVAALRDHAPLVHLGRLVLDRGWLDDPDRQVWMGRFLLDLSDTGVHRLLRGWTEDADAWTEATRRALRAVWLGAWHAASIDRLSLMCLIDRALKHHLPADRDAAVAARVAAVRAALQGGDLGAITLEALAQVPGAEVAALRAACPDEGTRAAFDALRQRLAARAVEVLEAAPKAVSQANAEELLARRVYTDPGHFLIELLQNAEDSGARRWRVRFEPRSVVVWHDGAPFDARDLVGVTSIGQTTKRQTQIGFFGVGFKAVYEITDRPRIFSDVYCFEIADVSIPRLLTARPAELPPDGTALVLPLRRPNDAERSAAALHQRALALDPVLLLTLRNLAHIEVERLDEQGNLTRWGVEAAEGTQGATTILRRLDGGEERWRCAAAEHRWEGQGREAVRTRQTRVMIGVRWGDEGPIAVPDGASTIYSFLPTAEASGLRFIVQGHFDVPVDRERISAESAWNKWIIEQLPQLLAALVAQSPSPAWAEVLPRVEEVGPLFRGVAERLRGLLSTTPCLPGLQGVAVPPLHAALAAGEEVAALGALPWRRRWLGLGGDGPLVWLDPAASPRARAMAAQLGVPALDGGRLVELVARGVSDPGPDGVALRDALVADVGRLAAVYDLLLGQIEALERQGRAGAAAAMIARLRGVPLIRDVLGALRPATAVRRGSAEVRALFEGLTGEPLAWVDPDLEAASERARALLTRLALVEIDVSAVLARLEVEVAGAASIDPADAPALLADAAIRRRLLALVAQAPWSVLERAARLPLFEARDGRCWRVAAGPHDRLGLLNVPFGPVGDALAALYGRRRPLAAADEAAWAQEAILERLSITSLGFDILILDLNTPEGPLADGGEGGLEGLHATLAALTDELAERQRAQLAATAIWPDRAGTLRPLVGEGRVHLAVNASVWTLFEQLPFAPSWLADLPHPRPMGAEVIGVEAVIAALDPAAAPPLRLEPAPETLERALAFILDNAHHVHARSRHRLLLAAVFLDDTGQSAGISELCIAEPPSLRALFAGWSERRFVAPGSTTAQVLERLDLGGHTERVDVAALIGDLVRVTAALTPAGLGRAEALRGWIERVVVGAPGWTALLQAAMVAGRGVLAERFPPQVRPGLPVANVLLTGLPIWPTRSGRLAAAGELVDPAGLDALLDGAALEDVTTDEDTWGRLLALTPLVAPRPAEDLVAAWLRERAKPGRPLSEQPSILASVERVAAVIEILARQGGDAALVACPLVDAAGRLRLDPLLNCADETRALLAALPLGRDLVNPALVALLNSAGERVKGYIAGRLSALEPLDVLHHVVTVLAEHDDPATARALLTPLWRWLVAREHEVFSQAEARALLRTAPLLLTRGGRRISAQEIVLDDDLPDLGLDWSPDPDIPDEALDVLARNLQIGRPDAESLVANHLLPAYTLAVTARDRPWAGALLSAIARRLPANNPALILRVFADSAILLEDHRGRFCPPHDLLWPDPDIEGWVEAVWGDDVPRPSALRYDDATLPFLAALGVRRTPSLQELSLALARPNPGEAAARGLAGICGHLHRQGVEVVEALGLRDRAWVMDETGCVRRPGALFLGTAELEALIGDYGELFVDSATPLIMGRLLSESLGFRGLQHVELGEIAHHLTIRSDARQPVSFAVYRWMERGLIEGRLDGRALAARLAHVRWICTDDGEYFEPRRVLGARALAIFGARRGYWERGAQECPGLCHWTGIPREIGAESIAALLDEIAQEVRREGDRALLERDRPLPRMVEAALAWLGERGQTLNPDLPVVPCREVGPGGATTARLLPARAANLFRSDTPTLEAMFARAGRFYVADLPTAPDARAAVEAALASAGVGLLREAWQVVADADAGTDRTDELTLRVQLLRALLRALLDVLPRVELQRAQLQPTGWRYRERLAPLSTTGPIRAIEGLRVFYDLRGVGRVPAPVVAAWDAAHATLLVEAHALLHMDQDTTGLATGLLPTLYEGAGEEQLVDIIEILLPLRDAARMHRYLDRRHFPAARRGLAPIDALAARVGELLDYGLHRRLARRFPVLARADFERWRRPDALAALEGQTGDLTALAAAHLLRAVGLDDPPGELLALLTGLLGAPSLSDIPPAWLGADAVPTAFEPDEDLGAPTLPPGQQPPGTLALLPELAPNANLEPIDWAAVMANLPTQSGAGVWGRLSRWLGIQEQGRRPIGTPDPADLPAWAQDTGNYMAPHSGIPPQLWATQALRARVAAQPPAAQLHFAPSPLRGPWLYGVHTIGASFDPATQRWSPSPMPSRRWFTDPAGEGHRVRFRGRLAPGWSQLPVPLFGRLTAPPEALDGRRIDAAPSEPWSTWRVFVHGDAWVDVHYEVELLQPPALTPWGALAAVPPELHTPVLHQRLLPREVRRWLEQEAAQTRAPWERALAVQHFVRVRYIHDEGFMEREDVQRALMELRAGVGYHHLAVLHASADEHVLGRGVCYELNSLVVELLRHMRVPALVATGWIFDLGVVARPDHLFALVPVATAAGPVLMPIDASAGRTGPVPLLPRPGADAAPAPAQEGAPALAGVWGFNAPAGTSENLNASLDALRAAETRRHREEAEALFGALDVVAAVHDQPIPESLQALRQRLDELPPEQVVRHMRSVLEGALGDPNLVQPLAQIVRGDYPRLPALSAEVQELVRRGYARVFTVPVYQISPARTRPQP